MSNEQNSSPEKRGLHDLVRDTVSLLHMAVVVLSLLLIISISMDTFQNIQYSHEPRFLKFEFWVCMLFIADFLAQMLRSPHKLRFFFTNILFFLISIPYLPLLHHFDVSVGPIAAYVLRFVPLIRGGYALALVVGWCTSNRATSMFVTYLATLASGVYFSSLIFYVFEHGPNPMVHDYWDALWWALMNCTTVGCNIVASTAVGKVLTVLVAALGTMMFPVFTVYITNLITRVHQANVQQR